MSITSRNARTLIAIAFAVAALLARPSLGHAQHRARLSTDLEEAIAHERPGVAVIVHGDRDTVRRLAERHGVRIKKLLRSGAVLEAERTELESLAQDPEIDHLSGDLPVRSSLDVTADTTGAAALWNGLDALPGITGRGVGIAVIDSGIAQHAALTGRVVLNIDFWSRGGRGDDQFGHGTHVAGIIAGDSTSTAGQRYRGMAPGAHLINLRVLGPDGSGDTSDVIEAIDWAIEYRKRYNIRVLNLSLGRPVTEESRDDPLCEAVERAVRAGLVVVASAGNLGKLEDGTPIAGGIVSPGNSAYALTVGALNTQQTPWRSDDVVTTYSSRGPTAIDGILKPDLVAPGNRIVSLEAPGSTIAREWPGAHVTGQGQDAYFLMSGSSMGTAVVSGAVALLLEANTLLDPAGVRLALQLTAAPVANAGILDAGAGSLNIVSAVRLVTAGVEPDTAFEGLPDPMFSGETLGHSGVVFGAFGNHLFDVLVPDESASDNDDTERERNAWSDARRIVWGDAKRIIWGDSKRIIWGDSKRIIWGDSKRIIWGDSKRIIWGDSKRIIWGDSKRIIWGDGTLDPWGDQVG